MAEQEPRRVVTRLTAENVLHLKAVDIAFEDGVAQVTGRNGAGKSSVLDSIMFALCGKSCQPTDPVRHGSKEGKVVVELDDIVVTRRWLESGSQTLTVESKDGSQRFNKPRDLLDSLLGPMTFDPLAFIRANQKDQIKRLMEVLGLDFTALDTKRAQCYEQRTDFNKRVSELRGRIVGISGDIQHQTAGKGLSIPDEPVNVEALLKEHSEVIDIVARQRTAVDSVDRAVANEGNAEAAVMRVQQELVQAKKTLEYHRENLTIAKGVAQEANKAVADARPMSAIQDDISKSNARNELYRLDGELKRQQKLQDDLDTKAQELTDEIDTIDEAKIKMLRDAKWPIEGLSFDSETVRYHDIPLDQCSSAEQLRTSAALGMAGNESIRVMFIKDGSLLDKDSMEALAEITAMNNYQLIIERVADPEEGIGVVIEDGGVYTGDQTQN